MFFQDGLTGSAWGDWALYTASPLRAFESEFGVQAPVGFWDPAGFTADGSVENFNRRRQTEIKHGRISMLATMGYITPEITGKFPGFLSPNAGLKFADVPNGLAAISKVPAAGWIQILAYAAFCEASQDQSGSGFFSGKYGLGFMKDTTMEGEPGNYATAIANGNFTILVKALQKAGLVETGAQLNVQIGGGTVKVGRATVTAADVACSNGVIHVIDKVLLPPAKPAEAFDPAQQIGAGAPLGFFDPLGFSKKGDKAGFNNLQASEIKHGRVHYVKFPGFESVPTGLGAVTTAPGTYGFAALFLVSGVLELAIWTQDDKKEPGNFGDPAGLNMYNPEMRQKEINNGRMGMFSAIGIIGAEVLSGKDGMNHAATGVLPPSAVADASAPSSVNLVGLATVGATLAAAASTRRRTQKVTRNFFGGDSTPARPSFEGSGFFSGKYGFGFMKDTTMEGEPGNYATAIANGNFTILVKALQKAGLVETVSGTTPYTGAQLNVQIGGGTVKVGRATVTAADVACSNGVIHVIDKVLLPPAKPAEAFDPAKQVGAGAPLGFFDPLGFSKKGDKAGFNNLQASEIKHGRVAMMAALGAVVQHYVKFPGFESVPTGLGAVTTAPGTYGFAALFLVSGVLELAIWTQDDKKEPGNFGDPAGLNMYNPEMRQKEINNGRMGMFSAIGIIGAEVLSGKDGMNQLGSALASAATGVLPPSAVADASAPSSVNLVGLTAVGATLAAAASTRRRTQKVTRNFFGGDSTPARPGFEVSNQSGIQEPIGFFDPLGFSADNDEATFKRRRTVEIKHGRVPLLGWFQIRWFAGLIEGSGFFSGKYGLGFMKDTTMEGEPGNYGAGFPTFLGKVEDPEVPAAGWIQILAYAAFCEASQVPAAGWIQILAYASFCEASQVPAAGWIQILAYAAFCEASQVPAAGWIQILAYAAFCEASQDQSAGTKASTGDFDFLASYYTDTRRNVEIANGRLAMMAIIGMFFQDGLTGSAWGDWALYTASPLRAVGSFAGYQAPQAEKSGRAAVVARRAENIAATAIANGNFTILVKALQKAGLVETVSGTTPYTVFAPTDAAFADLLKELKCTPEQLLANPDLKSILLYHVAGGTTMSSSLKDGMRVTSAQGAQLNVQIGSGTVKVGRATVTAADVACSNGVIHVIDKVLLPPAKPAEAFDPAKQVGAGAPLGFFDPLGFSKKGDKAGFNNLQASEIKHGRVAMMAALGAVVQHYVKFPGFESVPTGLGAVTTAPGTYGFAALFLVSGVLELAIWTQDDKKEPGNFGDPAGLNMYNPEMRQKEINNGRMGMFSAIGIIGAEVLSGKDGMNQLGF
ncbi:unnamed protein product [Polarella glacialis]|uniref:FAS1 domain-containing protein n=2 Tax=Polarella glacialis TaxID=89957 RepID=A0A813LW19_POLGL|nr:unnamed protein product [Polarella glacialis]